MGAPTNTYLRDTLQDDGSTPNTNAMGSASPDISPFTQIVASGNLASTFTTPTALQNDPGEPIEKNSTMFLYMRAQNPTGRAQTVTLSAYAAVNGAFAPQSQWRFIGSAQVTVPAQGAAVTRDPVTWTVTDDNSYCLVYTVSGPGIPPLPPINTANDFWNALQQYNVLALRNIYVVNDQTYSSVTYTQALQNTTSSEQTVLVRAICNLPVGSIVNLYCPQPAVGIAMSQQTTEQYQTIPTAGQLPPRFTGTLEAIVQPPNGAPPGMYGVQLEVTQYDTATGDFIPLSTENWIIGL